MIVVWVRAGSEGAAQGTVLEVTQMAQTGCLPELKDLAKALAVKMCPLNRANPEFHCQTEAVMARAKV